MKLVVIYHNGDKEKLEMSNPLDVIQDMKDKGFTNRWTCKYYDDNKDKIEWIVNSSHIRKMYIEE